MFLGSNGFPFGSATIQRQIQIGKALKEAGFLIAVICNKGSNTKAIAKREKILVNGYYQSIEYFYSSLCSYRPANYLKRNLHKLIGSLIEPILILYFRIFKNARYIFNNSMNLKQLKYYYFISRIFRMELIYDYVEFVSSLKNRDKTKISDLNGSFDFQFIKYIDKLIIISNFLENHVINIAAEIPRIMIPPIIDFSYFNTIKPVDVNTPYFLFCGSASYTDIIKFIIKSFYEYPKYLY